MDFATIGGIFLGLALILASLYGTGSGDFH